MTEHSCLQLNPNCFRCELAADELIGALQDVHQDLIVRFEASEVIIDPLVEQEILELTEERAGLLSTLGRWNVAVARLKD